MNTRIRWLWLAPCAALAAAGCGSSGSSAHAAGGPSSTTTTTAFVLPSTTTTTLYPTVTTPVRLDRYGVGLRKETFVDTTRNTPKSTAWPDGRRDRTMVTTIWYPSANAPSNHDVPDAPTARTGGPFALVVFGHGFEHSADHYQSLLHRWAAAGYVIAGPDLPSSSSHTQGVPNTIDEDQEPADLSFVATSMRTLGTTAGSWAQGLISPTQLIFSGHSQGGYDAFAAEFADRSHDPRITALVVFGTAADPGVYGHYTFDRPHPPVLMEAGTDDQVVGLRQDVLPVFAKLPHVADLLELAGAHDPTYESDATEYPARLAADAAIDFSDEYVKGDPTAAARLSADVRQAAQKLLVH